MHASLAWQWNPWQATQLLSMHELHAPSPGSGDTQELHFEAICNDVMQF